jgi:RNA polymerase sigma-70 factor (ECF subfamily)
LNELDLIRRCKAGDMQAYDSLIRPYLTMAFRTAALITHDHHLAQDAVQNALIEVYRTLDRFQESKSSSFRSWFYKIVVFRSLNMLRQTKPVAEYRERADIMPSPIETIVRNEEAEILRQAVRSMKVEYRTVLVLYYFEEFKVEEIADILKIRKGTVKSRLHKARKLLEKQLIAYRIYDFAAKELRNL